MKPEKTKQQRLQEAVERGLRLGALLDDPAVIGWFDEVDDTAAAGCCDAVVDGDDERLRAEAMRLALCRELRGRMIGHVAEGVRAQEELNRKRDNG